MQCQRRKTRCVGTENGRRACAYCRANGKECRFFDARAGRTALTRVNLERAEEEVRRLRGLLGVLCPDVDVDAAVMGKNVRRQRDEAQDDGGAIVF